jgi:hypothetical protein
MVDLLSPGVLALVGGALLFLVLAALALVFLGSVLVLVFIKTHHIFLPRITLVLVSMMEVPIKHLLWALKINTKKNDQEIVDLMIAKIRNKIYEKQFAKTPFKDRAIFLPQCIRHKDCPAKLSYEGIQCLGCGKCPAAKIKKEAEKLGYQFYIVPGGSFVKRLVKEHKPKAILGVGCHMEIKEGTALTSALGIPAQGVALTKDGCVNTTTNWDEVIRVMRMGAPKATK